MLKNNVHQAILELCEKVEQILTDRINTYGINEKVGRNTLQGSNLEKSIKVTPMEDGIALEIADYWEFISRGWKRTGNYPNTMSRWVKNVDDWVKRKGIRFGNMTQSQIVFVIIKNIINHGLKSRPFMVYDDDGDLTEMIPELKEYMEKWLDGLYNSIISEIDKFFNE